MKTHWELKNRRITNTGIYNKGKKAGREIKKENPQEDHCIQWSMDSLWSAPL